MKKYKKLSQSLNFEIKDKDEPNIMSWRDAMKKFDGKNKEKWRLPTKEELNLIFQNKDLVGGFANGSYWSSSENSANYAWEQYFHSGNQYYSSKDYNSYVRCVRSI